MKEEKALIHALGFFDTKPLIIAAFRYYLGRKTIAVHSFIASIYRAWPFLNDDIKDIVKRELEEACAEEAKYPGRLGMKMDADNWEWLRIKIEAEREE